MNKLNSTEIKGARQIKVPKFKLKNGFSTTPIRSQLMSKIGSKNTLPEIILRRQLWALGLRYRLNLKNLPGTPDIVFTKQKVVIFIDGDFWHGYDWKNKKKKIKTNRKFWIPKIERNIQRDHEITFILKKLGFKVVRFWDFEVQKDLDRCIKIIVNILDKRNL